MKKLLLLIPVLLIVGCTTPQPYKKSPEPKPYNWEYYDGTEQNIRSYFDENAASLGPIEGIFVLTNDYYDPAGDLLLKDEQQERLAIMKDKGSLSWEFKEVNLEEGTYFPKFAVTARFTQAANGLMYISKQFSPDGSSSSEHFTWDENTSTLTSERAQYASGRKFILKRKYLKIYPKTKGSTSSKAKLPNKISTGTGFFISNDGYLLTNNHVIEGASNISIILNNSSVPATLIDKDNSNDLALLKIDEKIVGLPIELKKKTKQGASIAVLGYPNIGLQGSEKKATFGYINANSGVQGDTRYYQISSPIQPGNSGSPVVNDSGVVIGIASASLNQSEAIKATGTLAQNVNYAVKIAYALPMLVSNGVEYIESSRQNSKEKTKLIESIDESVVLVVAE